MVEFGASPRSRSLFLSDFCAELRVRSHRGCPKGLCYFFVYRHQTTHRFWPRSEAFEALFPTPKTALVPTVAHKTVPESHVSILLTISLKCSSGASLVGTRSKVRLRRKNTPTKKIQKSPLPIDELSDIISPKFCFFH